MGSLKHGVIKIAIQDETYRGLQQLRDYYDTFVVRVVWMLVADRLRQLGVREEKIPKYRERVISPERRLRASKAISEWNAKPGSHEIRLKNAAKARETRTRKRLAKAAQHLGSIPHASATESDGCKKFRNGLPLQVPDANGLGNPTGSTVGGTGRRTIR